MLKNIIELPDGTRIGSGAAVPYAIQSCTITECVNSGEELTIGSTCCTCLEAQIITRDQKLGLSEGQLIKLYKADDSGAETQVGTFRLEMPTKKSDNVYKLTAFDLITDLDKDLSQWLKSKFTRWGCTLAEFADAVCVACDLQMKSMNFPNSTFPVPKFYKSGVTGRQLMQWIAEIAGCFCRATATGDIELAWYISSGVTIRPTGDRYYFAGGLTYEDYNVATIDAVKLRLADSDNGALWPNGDATNPYIITGNPILLAKITNDLPPYLDVIRSQLAALPAYKPCKVSLPAGLDIRAGQTVQVVDKHGNTFTTLVMIKTQTGQRDTLECTGSARRNSATAANNKSAAQIGAEQEGYAQSAAQQAVENQSWESLFNKWTNNGSIQGFFAQDGVWIFNAAVGKIANFIAEMITAGKLKSVDEKTYFDLDSGKLVSTSEKGHRIEIVDGNIEVFDTSGNLRIWITQGDHTYVYVCDNDGNICGGVGVGHGRFQVMAPDGSLDGTIVGQPVAWKEINGEKVLAVAT